MTTVDTPRSRREAIFEVRKPLSPVGWAAILGSVAILSRNIFGLIVNPDFSAGTRAFDLSRAETV